MADTFKAPARVVGVICAARHDRIVHYGPACPLCQAATLLEEAKEAVDMLKDERDRAVIAMTQMRTAHNAIVGSALLVSP